MGVLHCIVNPASRDHTCGKKWPNVAAKLEQNGFDVITHMTERVGHASEIAWELRNQQVDGPIVAVGGDGHLNEVLNGFIENDLPVNAESRLSFVMTGTGCDFQRSIGI